MKLEVIFRSEGAVEAIVGETEAGTWPEARRALPKLLRELADEFEAASDDEEMPDATPDA
ncbi:hypothetical protein ACWD3Z_05520 [Streptomyces sp. NPDC002740]